MSNTTDDDRSELLDDDKIETDYPPDRSLAVEDYGTTAAEQRIDEPLEERVHRELPERPPRGLDDEEIEGIRPVGDLVDPAPGATDVEGELGGGPGLDGELDVGDPAAGDSTTRDVATEKIGPRPAEEDAMHITEPPE